jgi:hypothetical protein
MFSPFQHNYERQFPFRNRAISTRNTLTTISVILNFDSKRCCPNMAAMA